MEFIYSHLLGGIPSIKNFDLYLYIYMFCLEVFTFNYGSEYEEYSSPTTFWILFAACC